MDQKHYNMMNWEAIESIVYADCSNPFDILSVSKKGKSKLIQAFYPDAQKVSAEFVVEGKTKTLKLEKVDEAGFFAEFFNFEYESYTFKVEYEKKVIDKVVDPYSIRVETDANSIKDILKGKSCKAYEFLGSHKKKYGTTEGYEFLLYAPKADSVSVVGDFNDWKENANLMQSDSSIKGLYKLFIPDLADSSEYKYVINHKGKRIYKNDPFALGIKNDNSVCVPFEYSGKKSKKKICPADLDLQILEVDINSLFAKFKNVDAIGEYLCTHIKKFDYNCVLFINLFKSNNPNDIYEIISPYSFDSAHGLDTKSLKSVMKKLKGIGVNMFVELPLAYASDCESGLSLFDGGNLFENEDERLSKHNMYKAMLYDFTHPFTKSFLLSCVNLFMNEFDFSGYVLPNTGVLLYHDYNKNPGEFITEEWGSTLNSKGVAFVKEINRFVHKEYKNALCIASIYAFYKDVTGKSPDSLCFDYCLNTGACEEILEFLKLEPVFRRDRLDSFLLFTHFSNNEEKYIYPYSRKENTKDFATIYDRMPGDKMQKLSNLKMAVIFKHLLFGAQLMNLDIDENDGLENDIREKYFSFLYDFRRVYESNKHRIRNFNADRPFSYKCIDNQVFTREYFDGTKDYIIVFNFSKDSYQKYNIPVSHEGVYREVFSSDNVSYGGTGILNKKILETSDSENSDAFTLTVKLPALSIIAFEYRKFTKEELEAIFQKKKKAMIKFVDGEKKKIKEELNANIEILKKDAQKRMDELDELLVPYNKQRLN